jgi:transaldolase
MSLFLDSAVLGDARQAGGYGFIVGCTTNPALLAAAGFKTAEEAMLALCPLFEGTVFCQLAGHTLEGMRPEAERLMLLASNVGLKIACTLEGLRLAAELSERATVAVTGVFTPAQAYLAAQAGAHYVIPYVNRMTRFTGDGPNVVDAMANILAPTSTEILAAGIKSPAEAVDTLLAGAHHVSLPLSVIHEMAQNALTEKAIADFDAAWAARAGAR